MEHEVQFDNKRKTLPRLEMHLNTRGNVGSPLKDKCTGAAWLSSARALKCSLKWGNERNPHCVLDMSHRTAPVFAQELVSCVKTGEEGADDVKSAWPSDALGHTRATMAETMGCQPARGS